MTTDLTDAEVVAVAKALGDSRVSRARAAIPNDSTEEIDVTIRFKGTVSRAVAIPDSTKSVTDKLSVDQDAVHAAALKKLGVKRNDYDLAYKAAHESASKRLVKEQAAIKPRQVAVKGRDGDITAAIDVTRV